MRMTKKAKAILTSFKAQTPTLTKKVATLSAQVKKLNHVSYDQRTMVMAADTATNVVQPFYQYHVTGRMNTWAPIFGSAAVDVDNSEKVYVNEYKLDARLYQDNEPDRIFYTAFVVSLKDQAADSTTFDPATGNLTLASGLHYAQTNTVGKVFLNPGFFTIHSYKRFYMGGRAGDQSAPEVRDISFTIKPKQRMIVNPKGNVFNNAAFTFPKDPSQNYYLLLFNDDLGADLQTNKINIGGIANIAVPS